MKNFLKLLALFVCFATFVVACNNDDTVDDYVPKVEAIDTNTVTIARGSEKIYVEWTVPDDSTITGAKVSWSSENDKGSEIFTEPRANDKVEYVIEDLVDGETYTVIIASLVDGRVGSETVTSDLLEVYGPQTYKEAVVPTISGNAASYNDSDGSATISWEGIDKDASYLSGVNVKYEDINGATPIEETEFDGLQETATTNLPNAKEESYFTFKALYKPADGYDYAEIDVDGEYIIENGMLTLATPTIHSALSGNGRIQFSWSVSGDVVRSEVTLYEISVGYDDAALSGDPIVVTKTAYQTGDGYVVTADTQNNIFTATVSAFGGASLESGKNYRAEITNYISDELSKTASTEESMLVYDSNSYDNVATPVISSLNNYGSSVISIEFNAGATGSVTSSDLKKVLVSYTPSGGALTVEDDVVEYFDGETILPRAYTGYGYSCKAYFSPVNCIEGDEVTRDVNVGTLSANNGVIPAPELTQISGVELMRGYTGGDSYIVANWGALDKASSDYYEIEEITIYYDTNEDKVLAGTSLYMDNVDRDSATQSVTSLTADQTYYVSVAIKDIAGGYTYSEIAQVDTYGADTYANEVSLLSTGSNAEIFYDGGDAASITWDWNSATDAKSVEITNYTNKDTPANSTVGKVYADGSYNLTILPNAQGGSVATYKAYFLPENGIDEVAMEGTLNLPFLPISEPIMTLTTEVDTGKVTASWTYDSTTGKPENIKDIILYYGVRDENGDVASYSSTTPKEPTADETSNSIEISSLSDATYAIYMTVTDDENSVNNVLETATEDNPQTIRVYNTNSYKGDLLEGGEDLVATDTPVVEDAVTTEEDLIIGFNPDNAADVVGVEITYSGTAETKSVTRSVEYTTQTEGEKDYTKLEDSTIPTSFTIPLSRMEPGAGYSYTIYYKPEGGDSAVAGDTAPEIEVPPVIPPTAVLATVTSSYDDEDKPTLNVVWTLADINRSYIKDGAMKLFCLKSGETIKDHADTDPTATVTAVDGITEYSITLTSDDHGIEAGQSYTIYIWTERSGSITGTYAGDYAEEYKSNEATDVKAYNEALYADAVPTATSTADANGSVRVMWSGYDNADLSGVVVSYGGTDVATLTKSELTSTMSFKYVSATDLFTYTASFDLGEYATSVVLYDKVVSLSNNGYISSVTCDLKYVSGVYEIYTAKGLAAFATIVNGEDTSIIERWSTNTDNTIDSWTQNTGANAKLMANIYLSDIVGVDAGAQGAEVNWTPIGGSSTANVTAAGYTGTFDGNGYTITGLYINSTYQYQGLFGYVGAATIKNVTLDSPNVTTTNTASAFLVGRVSASNLIENCNITGNGSLVAGNNSGGIVGNALGVITNCHVASTVTLEATGDGSTSAGFGGIVGNAGAGVYIVNCSNAAKVYSPTANDGKGTNSIGGIVGVSSNADGAKVIGCYNTGDISGNTYAAGIVGITVSNSTSLVMACYNTGTITATSSLTGGVIGRWQSGTAVANYATGKIVITGTTANSVGIVFGNYTAISGTVTIGTTLTANYYVKDAGQAAGYNGNEMIGIGYGSSAYEVKGNLDALDDLAALNANNPIYMMNEALETAYAANSIDASYQYFYDYGTQTPTFVTSKPSYEWVVPDPDIKFYTAADSYYAVDTYEIYTALGLAAFGDLVAGTDVYTSKAETNDTFDDWTQNKAAVAVLMADIDLSDMFSATLGVSWTPIGGTSEATFEGSLNGNYKKIENLYISTSSDNAGLFGYLNTGATISNVTLYNPIVSSSASNTGALAGKAVGATIESCYTTGSKATISGTENTGGFVGTLEASAKITGCINAATVKGVTNTGGIVGLNLASASIFTSSNEGTVIGTGTDTGGVVGNNAGDITGSTSSPLSYNNGTVTGTTNVGGIVGNNSGTLSYYENYGLFTSTDAETTGGVYGVNTGTVDDSCEDKYVDPTTYDIIVNDDGIYEIRSAVGLKAFSDLVNGVENDTAIAPQEVVFSTTALVDISAKLTVDIDLADLGATTSWSPIGTSSNAYTGTFDGDSKVISNLYINAETQCQGLFGNVGAGTIKNVILSEVDVTTTYAGSPTIAGALVGGASGTTITSCEVSSGSVVASSTSAQYLASIVGHLQGADVTITNCINRASVTCGRYHAAGIVAGSNSGSRAVSITNSDNYGAIYATSGYAGGIMAYANSAASQITDCNNYGSVEAGGNYVGGIIGVESTGSTLVISTSENQGSITGAQYVGGIAGSLLAGGTITGLDTDNRSYNRGDVSGTDYVGGIVGNNAGIISFYNNTGIVTATNENVGDITGSNSGTVTGCDHIEIDPAEKAIDVTAYPTCDVSEDISTIVVSWDYETTPENVASVNIYYRNSTEQESDYNTVLIEYGDGTTKSYTLGVNEDLVAGAVYDVYIETINANSKATESDYTDESPLQVTIYNAASYAAKLPTVDVALEDTTATLTWSNVDDDLVSVTVSYNGGEETIAKADLTTSTLTYVYGKFDFTYTAIFKPLAYAADENVASVTVKDQESQTVYIVTPYTAEESDLYLNDDGVYEIRTAKGLIAFTYIVAGTGDATTDAATNNIVFGGDAIPAANAKVMEDFTFSGTYTAITDYAGTFDGNSKTISGFTTSDDGLFATTSNGAVIKDLTLEDPYITSDSADGKGAFVGVADGIYIYNCHVTVTEENANSKQLFSTTTNTSGGIVGSTLSGGANTSTIISCSNAASITGATHSGGIIGKIYNNTTVKYCLNTGALTLGRYGGGIGAIENGTGQIVSCTNRGNITTTYGQTGGITGSVYSGASVIYSANEGNISGGHATVGGIAGQHYLAGIVDGTKPTDYSTSDYNYALLGELGGNYNSGTVTGTTPVGGIIGSVSTTGTLKYYNNLSTATVTGTTSVGGIAGYNGNTITGDTSTNNYNAAAVYATNSDGYAGGLIGNNAGSITNYTNTAAVYVNNVLQNSVTVAHLVGTGTDAGDGCEGTYDPDAIDPETTDIYLDKTTSIYEIRTAEGLVAFAGIVNGTAATETPTTTKGTNITDWSQNVAASAQLMADFSLSTICGSTVGEGTSWTPIGTNTSGYQYTGTFDGNGKTISDLYINATTQYQGLFGYVGNNGVVQDLTLANVNITVDLSTAVSYTAAVAGNVSGANAKISGCEVSSGTITASSTAAYIAGIAGEIQTSTITGCVNRATVTSANGHLGGIVGAVRSGTSSTSGTISYCTNYGKIASTAGDNTGGIVGYVHASSAGVTVTNCYNYGVISAAAKCVGGIAGAIQGHSGTATVSGCINYATGTVTSTGTYDAAGVVGQVFVRNSNTASVTIENCINNAAVTASSADRVGGILGGDTSTGGLGYVTNCSNTGAITGKTSVGGIVGLTYYYNDTYTYTMTVYGNTDGTAKNTGKIIGTSATGAIVGTNAAECTVSYYTNTGEVLVDGENNNGNGDATIVGSNSGTITECTEAYVYVEPAEPVTVTSASSNEDCDAIDVEWSYGEKTLISKVIIYYKLSTESNYTLVEITDLTQTEATISGLTKDATYNLYVVTANTNAVETAATDGGTSDTPLVVVMTNEPSIDPDTTDIYYNAEGVYEIRTAEGLAAFRDIVNDTLTSVDDLTTNVAAGTTSTAASAILINNITLDGATGTSWTPIGTSSNAYTGTFDGDGKTISNLYINATTAYQGLFGYAGTGEIKNVKLSNVSVTSSYSSNPVALAALVGGAAADLTITSCEVVSGAVVCTGSAGQYLGGIVGAMPGGGLLVQNSINRASVTGQTYNVGGIVGGTGENNKTVTITNCENYGAISGARYLGGIMAYAAGTSSVVTITSCTNYGSVTGNTSNSSYPYFGGILAYGVGTTTIRNSSNEGDIVGQVSVGGIAGAISANSTITGEIVAGDGNIAYNKGAVTGYAATSTGALVGTNAGTSTNYVNTGAVSPTQQLIGTASTVADAGDGCSDLYVNLSSYDLALNASGVYEINSDKGLVAFADLVNGVDLSNGASTYDTSTSAAITFGTAVTTANAKVMNDITLTDEWTPITGYAGTFDGGNESEYTISGLKITNATTTNQGLFATIAGGTVQNVTLTSVAITSSGNQVGGIAGYTSGGATITNCNVSGTIQGGASYTGGIVGYNYGGDSGDGSVVKDCINNATVGGTATVGGIVGYNYPYKTTSPCLVDGCTNNGAVSATGAQVGGIVGYNRGTGTLGGFVPEDGEYAGYGSIVQNCTNSATGTVSGGSSVGTIVGDNANAAAIVKNNENYNTSYQNMLIGTGSGASDSNSDIGEPAATGDNVDVTIDGTIDGTTPGTSEGSSDGSAGDGNGDLGGVTEGGF